MRGQRVQHVSADKHSSNPWPAGQYGVGWWPCLLLGTQGCDMWQVNRLAIFALKKTSHYVCKWSQATELMYAMAALKHHLSVCAWVNASAQIVGGQGAIGAWHIFILTPVIEDLKHKDGKQPSCVKLIGVCVVLSVFEPLLYLFGMRQVGRPACSLHLSPPPSLFSPVDSESNVCAVPCCTIN